MDEGHGQLLHTRAARKQSQGVTGRRGGSMKGGKGAVQQTGLRTDGTALAAYGR